jgi:uncharacterized protein (TIGR03083 family)
VDKDTLWTYVEAERHSLADLLETLTPEQWEQPSLCSQWRVRDVAGHLAMTPAGDPSTGEMVRGLVRNRGDLWAMGRDVAVAWSARPPEEIVAVLRSQAASRRRPAVTTDANVLLDVVVHGQDIAVPLGLERPVPSAAGLASFDRIWRMGWPFWARRRLRGVTLVATDADLRVGDGPEVRGSLAALLLLVSGRTAAARELLDGPGVARLAA